MTPLEQIKTGILKQDMSLVVQGYNRITNDNISIPKPKATKVKQPRITRAEVSGVPEEERSFEFSGEKKQASTDQFVRKKRINLFADTGENPEGYTVEDKKFDRKTKKLARAERPKPYKPIDIACSFCGRMYSVNPVFVIGGVYRCDRCSKG